VCLDVGVHVDGYIADAAVTVDHTGTPELVEAAEMALEAAVDEAGPGVEVGVVGQAIEDVIRGYGYTPVLNLSGHGVERYDAHTGPTVPNRGVDRSVELEPGQAVAIEPFATDGRGKVGEGTEEEIFERQGSGARPRPRARQALDEIEAFDDLPFAARWLEGDRVEMALRRLKQANAVKGYPVLKGGRRRARQSGGTHPARHRRRRRDHDRRHPRLRRLMDRIYAPWRIEWVERDADPIEGCPFCVLPEREDARDARVVARSERNYVLLNNAPYNGGTRW